MVKESNKLRQNQKLNFFLVLFSLAPPLLRGLNTKLFTLLKVACELVKS